MASSRDPATTSDRSDADIAGSKMDQQVLRIDEQEVAEEIQDSNVNENNEDQNAQLPDVEVSVCKKRPSDIGSLGAAYR
ncbi:hypothetical protein PsorP6_016161 [Peronosclerospora sorghi]|uniref:Uncharacterized protein n=1 Tax=Peronosclerospora sorghi TaxID=230839 RepID=A0ACC0VJX1_9STRA|nr:hypothetical protein PsorP6_016161 [Peronosclerospora sorghi]